MADLAARQRRSKDVPNARFYDDLFKKNPGALAQERENFRRTLKLAQPLERTVKLTREAVDVETRTVTFSLSSETPVARWFGMEVLGHQPGEIDTSIITDAAPYLDFHDMDEQRGVVQKFWVENGRSMVTCLLSRSPEGEQLLQDHADGIRVHSSVGYFVSEFKDVTPPTAGPNDPPVFRATKWTPFEASSVPLGADPTVGVGRSQAAPITPANKRMTIMNEKQIRALIARREAGETLTEAEISAISVFELGQRSAPVTAPAPAPAPTPESRSAIEQGVLTAERKRRDDIQAIMDRFDGNEAIRQMCLKDIKEGAAPQDTGMRALEILGKAQAVTAVSGGEAREMGFTEKQLGGYSVRKAIMSQARDGKLDGLELEVHTELGRRGMKAENGGVLVPWNSLGGQRAMTASSFGAGGALVSTQPQEFVELLRNRTKVMSMGANLLSGLKGDIYLPRQTGASTMYWVADAATVTESDLSVGQIHLRPNTAGARTEFSRQLLIQSDPSIDGLISRDLEAVLGIGMDLAALSGSGVTGQPLGILNTTGVGSQSVSSATWGNMVAFETKITQANADVVNMGWLANPAVRGTLKTRTQVSGGTTPPFVWDNDSMIGYKAQVTNQLTSSQVVFGDWGQLVVALWGPGIELKLVEFPVNYAAGNMELIAFLSMDVAVRQVGAFCVGTNFS